MLSVILAPNPGDWLRTQVNLLHAARKVGAKRFSPSEFSMGPRAHDKCLPIFQPKVEWWEECRRVAAEAGAKGEGFEVARFHTGYFMNYLGYGAPFETEIALGGRGEDDPELFFHLRDAWIKIPERDGGGVPRITLTELADVGRFLRAAVELAEGEWEKEMGMAGETLRFDEVGKLFEEVTGRKVRVETVKRKELERGMEECRERGDVLGMLGYQFSLCYCEDKEGVGVVEGVVNRKCQHVKPTKVRAFMERFWAGKRT